MTAVIFGCIFAILLQSVAVSATIPTENIPTSMSGTYPDWKLIPDVSLDCEGHNIITISHRTARISLNGAFEGVISSSNAMYQTAPDQFGNYVPVIAISILRGPHWILAESDGNGVWLFNDRGRFYKCQPR
jgi:hypothetical protein